MNGRHLIVLLILLSLWLTSGCRSGNSDGARIPPPYSEELEKRKDNDRLEFLSDCIRRGIDLADSYYKRAELYLEKSDFESALSDINSAIASKDNIGEYYLLRGVINREMNRLDAALQDAERAEALQQKSPRLYILMADILQEKEKYTEANRYISGVLALAPYDASVYFVQGVLQTKSGDTLQGLSSMEKALDLNPLYYRAYQRISSLYLIRDDFQNAHRILDKGIRHFPDNTDLLVQMGRMYSNRALNDSSLIYYARAVQSKKNDLNILSEMAGVYTRARNYESALKIYEEINRRNPDFPSINYLIGFSLEKMWRVNQAKAYYEKELEITPGYVPARNGLWRISQLELERANSNANESAQQPVKTLDDTRLEITPIQPRAIKK